MNHAGAVSYPRLSFSLLPTPFQHCRNLSAQLGHAVYCKRDDLTGFAFGGNKTRKLDFLMAEAKKQGAYAVVTAGANQSNFCRIAAFAAAASGMEAHLVLGGKKPARPTGNLLLSCLSGAHIHHVDSRNWETWEKKANIIASDLERKGKKVFRMPIGGSTPLGVLGYVECFKEMMDDASRLHIAFDTVFHASSSAGTQAGLVVGKALTGWPGRIIGIAVAKNRITSTDEVFGLALKAAELVGATVTCDMVHVDDSYLGKGYGYTTKECGNAIALFGRAEGIMLDHVYTGKAAAGMLGHIAAGKCAASRGTVFLHTGGNTELFE